MLVDYDKVNVTTKVTPIINGVASLIVNLPNTVILEYENSTAAIGARFDGVDGTKQP